jgi:hypothetical protein
MATNSPKWNLLRKFRVRSSVNASRLYDVVIPARSAGIQVDMDVSGRILRTWIPAIHAGMTEKEG